MRILFNLYRVICFAAFFVLQANPVFSQHILVKDIPSQSKLPVNAIHRIFQDSDGYMWFGTFNGLCRYDGYSIRVLRSDLLHPGLLADNYITYIAEDHEKKIWFGTMKGAYILDKGTYQITPVNLEGFSAPQVFSINVIRDGTVWVSVAGVLFRYNPDGSVLRKYKMEYNGTPRFVYIVYEDKAGDLLVSITGGGMYKLNKKTDEFEAYHHHPDYRDVERIIWDETNGCYWLGTWGKGIVRFDPQQREPEQQYVPQPLPVDVLGNPTGNLFHMVQDNTFHYLWVTTQRDLFAFRITGQKTLEQVDLSSVLSPENKILYEIYKDKTGKLWVSAFDRPSFIVDIRDYVVKEYPLNALKNKLKANPAIQSLCVDGEGVFWFSQERYGLCTYDPGSERFRQFSESRETLGLPFWEVPVMISSRSQGSIWAMPHGATIYGLRQQNGEMKESVQIKLSEKASTPGTCSSLFEDRNQNLWIGTTTGLFVYRIRTGNLEVISENTGHISGITQTMDGRIWVVVRNKGVAQVNSENQLEMFPFDKDFLCVDATSDGKLWMGTGEGEILLFDTRTKKLTDQSLACGMKGDIINSITVDTYNHIWIATNQMIKEYNPRNGGYRSYNTHNDNFLPERLLAHAVHYNGEGEIYFGGVSGIVSITPSQQLESIPEQVTTHISDIKILGRSIWEGGLKEDPLRTVLSIPSDAQNLEIEFSSLDFHYLDQIRYAYRMVGVDKDWIYLDEGRNSAFYNKLDKGEYTFQVKATDKNGLWSDKITEFRIHREPAYYETWWAYTLYLLIALSLVAVAILLYLKRVKHEYKEEMDRQIELKISELEGKPSPDEAFLNKAVEVVETHLSDQEFDTVKLAGEMHMSRSTFTRKIKAVTGHTPLTFIKDIKMQHARRMLEHTNTSVSEVVTALGYNDHKHFTASFKDTFGITPSEYQKETKKADER